MTRPDNPATHGSDAPAMADLAWAVAGLPGAGAHLQQAQELTHWSQHVIMNVSFDVVRNALFVDVTDTFSADPAFLAAFPEETQVQVSDDLVYSYVVVAGFAVMTGCCLTNARENLGTGADALLEALVGTEVSLQARHLVQASRTGSLTVPLAPSVVRDLLITWTLHAGQTSGPWDDETTRGLVTTLSDSHLGEIVAQWMAELTEDGQLVPEVVRGHDGAVRLAGQQETGTGSDVAPLEIDDSFLPSVLTEAWTPDDGPLELEAVAVSDGLAVRLPLPGPVKPGLRVYAAVLLDGATVDVELTGGPEAGGLPGVVSGVQAVGPGSHARLVGLVVRRAEAA